MRTPDLTNARWTKSSYSGNNGGNCLELAHRVRNFAPVRDSKAGAEGPSLPFTRPSWASFLSALQRGELGA
ncbi:DUF397 domain-containing protein [Streptomyces albidoflavus]|uniref:DUF397 domain-containing protein n=1 Tax=Streptomyces albidoflavus TaxID=1886 RepID=UPI0033A3174F